MNDGAKAGTRMERVDGIIRFVHSLKDVRDKMVNGKFSFQVLRDQFGDIRTTLVSTKRSALPHTTRHQLEGTRRDLVARSSDTNDARHTPTTVSAFQGGAHDAGVSGTVKGVITPPGG